MPQANAQTPALPTHAAAATPVPPDARVSPDTPEAALKRIVQLFNQLQPSDVARLGQFYCPDAHFKDPFNEVQGLSEVQRIFDHMFVALHAPRFVVTQAVQQAEHAFVTWDFLFALRSQPNTQFTVRGATHFVLRQQQGRWCVAVHRDYWDVAEELYEKLPVLGSLMRWLKRRVNG